MAVSAFTQAEFASRVGKPACGHLDVTPLGVDASWFDVARSSPLDHVRPSFVCVGSVRPHKNISRLLQAFAQVVERVPHTLVIAGLAAPEDKLRQMIAALPAAVQQRILFTGRVPDAELQRLVGAADALVFPSLYEGFGLPALEAMAAGCPVLASTAGALSEVCGTAAAGHFDPHSVPELAQEMARHAALGEAELKSVVRQGVAHARRFTWERTADLTAAALHKVLGTS